MTSGTETGQHMRVLPQQPGDWAWRRRVRANPTARRIYRTVVGVLGAAIIVIGLALVPLPGPGWLVVFLGVGLLATEFAWAHRLHGWGTARLRSWEAWVLGRSLRTRAALASLTMVTVCALVWLLLRWTGLPSWLPGAAADPMRQYLGL